MLAAHIALAPKQWADRAALLAAPVEAHISAGPVDLPSALGYGRELAAGSGSFDADLRGTLGEPILEVAASTSPLTAGGKSLGRLESHGRYRARKASLEAKVFPANGRNFGADTESGVNANEVRVEYQISPRISLESQYGDQGRGGANVVYSRDC